MNNAPDTLYALRTCCCSACARQTTMASTESAPLYGTQTYVDQYGWDDHAVRQLGVRRELRDVDQLTAGGG